jgi:hypothetical protein
VGAAVHQALLSALPVSPSVTLLTRNAPVHRNTVTFDDNSGSQWAAPRGAMNYSLSITFAEVAIRIKTFGRLTLTYLCRL